MTWMCHWWWQTWTSSSIWMRTFRVVKFHLLNTRNKYATMPIIEGSRSPALMKWRSFSSRHKQIENSDDDDDDGKVRWMGEWELNVKIWKWAVWQWENMTGMGKVSALLSSYGCKIVFFFVFVTECALWTTVLVVLLA